MRYPPTTSSQSMGCSLPSEVPLIILYTDRTYLRYTKRSRDLNDISERLVMEMPR